jgi:hypothetical protein
MAAACRHAPVVCWLQRSNLPQWQLLGRSILLLAIQIGR